MSSVDQLMTQMDQFLAMLLNNPPMLLALIIVIAAVVFISKKMDGDVDDGTDFEGKDWEKIIPSDFKKQLADTGLDSDKDLTRGEETEFGSVYRYDTVQMPSEMEFKDFLFNLDSEGEEQPDLDAEDDFEEVYIFLVAPDSRMGKFMWKLTDVKLGMDMNTTIFVVTESSVEVERDRFRLNPDIDFKLEYDVIYTEKQVASENVTDQVPLYQARKNIIEGLEEFTMKTLYFDRQHTSSVAQMREDVDEEALEKLLDKGKNF